MSTMLAEALISSIFDSGILIFHWQINAKSGINKAQYILKRAVFSPFLTFYMHLTICYI